MKAMLAFTALLVTLFTNTPIKTYKTDQASSSMRISGTSTLHDWEVEAESFKGSMEVDLFTDSIAIRELKLTVPVTSLKSGKTPMDNNMYKALKAEDHTNINYVFTRLINVKTLPGNKLELLTEGKLTVAGKTQILKIPLTATVKEHGIEFRGSKKLTMSQFNVEAPSFMFGSVTTGDAININFTINFN
tara:strand:+ start:2132 stop:2698 length:567 start_codon:yes stop_codon:yes gene_type:complete